MEGRGPSRAATRYGPAPGQAAPRSRAPPRRAPIGSFQYVEITKDIAKHAGRLKFEWARKGVTLSTPDTTIAAVALAHTLILITDNRKHYPMRDLRVFEDTRS